MIALLILLFVSPAFAHRPGLCIEETLKTPCASMILCIGNDWESLETQREDCSWRYTCYRGHRGFKRAMRRWRRERGWSMREYKSLLPGHKQMGLGVKDG